MPISQNTLRTLQPQERLQRKVWLTAHHQKFAEQPHTACCHTRLPRLVERASCPRAETARIHAAPGGRGGVGGSSQLWVVAFTKLMRFHSCTGAAPMTTLQKSLQNREGNGQPLLALNPKVQDIRPREAAPQIIAHDPPPEVPLAAVGHPLL